MNPKYINLLKNRGKIKTSNDKEVELYELELSSDDEILNEWANIFRQNYCLDSEIDLLRSGYGLSREEYLETIKFPDKDDRLGRATRSGDFGELLIADYAEFILNYYVPRTRYDRKINRNSSAQGSDMLAFKLGENVSSNDEILIFEVKSQASETNPMNKLKDAIVHSNKDVKRIAESLNAVNQRLIDRGLIEEAKRIQRFQNATDRPYRKRYAAAAIHSKTSFSEEVIKTCTTQEHTNPDLMLLVVYSDKLMKTIHDLYRRAAKC